MPKRAELLLGKVVVTGQEAVEGQSGMRQDLYKKHATGDPVAARLPYGLITRQVELIGCKRLEMNKVIRFEGVAKEALESIFRRGSSPRSSPSISRRAHFSAIICVITAR